MTDRELMQMALDALDEVEPSYYDTPSFKQPFFNVRKALRERLSREAALDKLVADAESLGLYDTVPPKREWVEITRGEISEIWGNSQQTIDEEKDAIAFGFAIEAKLKEKNT